MGPATLLTRLEPRVVAAVMARLAPLDYRRGQTIFAQGQPGEGLYIVATGKVAIACRSPQGRAHLRAVLGPSEIFGAVAACDPAPRTSTAWALTEVRVLSLTRSDLQHLIAEHPQVSEQLLRVLARRLRRVLDTEADLVFADVPARVAKQLLRLAQQFGAQQDSAIVVSHDLTQAELAQLVGSSRVAVNRALAEFTHRGWIRAHDAGVAILDSEGLARRAGQ